MKRMPRVPWRRMAVMVARMVRVFSGRKRVRVRMPQSMVCIRDGCVGSREGRRRERMLHRREERRISKR